jgi:glycosyltransferase involved in cell wall biosynthesis
LYVGRLHPIKGIENLLRALKLVHDDAVTLSIYGDGESSYVNTLSAVVRQLALMDRVAFCGHVDGNDKFDAFMRADVCIVPSYSENFGMVIAEALAHAVPVIAGTGTPWADLEQRGCGLWVDNSPEALTKAIRKIRDLPLRTMGERGRAWMQRDYGWKSVVQQMYDLYRRQMHRCMIP